MSSTRLALGTAQWGLDYGIANRSGRPGTAEIAAILRIAEASGIDTLDTARAYGDSERLIGELAGRQWQIVTKLAPTADSAVSAQCSLDESRTALKRERLDGVLLHRGHQRTIAGGVVWDILRRERDRGTIRKIGVSAVDPDEAHAAVEDADVAYMQVATSLFDQRLVRAGFFERAARLGKQVFVRSVFLQGAARLTPEELPPHLSPLLDPLRRAEKWAGERDVSIASVFLAYVARIPDVRVLVGCESAAQVSENVNAWTDANRLTGAVGALGDSIEPLPEQVVNPSLWAARDRS
jgi:aryl-alcohol dehydrogenase-like predicted oxidoreductase